MANVVIASGYLTCPHQGKLTLTSSAKLTVSGTPVVPFSALPTAPQTYIGCTYQMSGSPAPCTVTTPTGGGQSAKLSAGGAALLDDLIATAGTPATPAPATVTAGQSKLTAS